MCSADYMRGSVCLRPKSRLAMVSDFTAVTARERKPTMMLAPILRALVLMLALCCAAASARADDRGVEEAGVSAGRGAMPALAESQALERAAAPFETLTTGLRRRLKLRLRFDWIRSYTALGPHLYLASSIPTRALRQRTRA